MRWRRKIKESTSLLNVKILTINAIPGPAQYPSSHKTCLKIAVVLKLLLLQQDPLWLKLRLLSSSVTFVQSRSKLKVESTSVLVPVYTQLRKCHFGWERVPSPNTRGQNESFHLVEPILSHINKTSEDVLHQKFINIRVTSDFTVEASVPDQCWNVLFGPNTRLDSRIRPRKSAVLLNGQIMLTHFARPTIVSPKPTGESDYCEVNNSGWTVDVINNSSRLKFTTNTRSLWLKPLHLVRAIV